jgi:hypothetical protein
MAIHEELTSLTDLRALFAVEYVSLSFPAMSAGYEHLFYYVLDVLNIGYMPIIKSFLKTAHYFPAALMGPAVVIPHGNGGLAYRGFNSSRIEGHDLPIALANVMNHGFDSFPCCMCVGNARYLWSFLPHEQDLHD